MAQLTVALRAPSLGLPIFMTKLLLTALALFAFPLAASAQLDLPDSAGKARTVKEGPRSESGDIAPHLVCTVCGTRNYTAARDRPATETDQYYAICSYCREDRRHRDGGSGSAADIDFPDRERVKPVELEPTPSLPEPPLVPGTLSPQARFILEQIAKSSDAGASLQAQAERGLIALGEDGVFAARVALLDERPALIKLGANVLLSTRRGVEIERVAQRLRDPLPGRIGPAILESLVATDPVHASPTLLCDLLDHRQGAVRQAASKHLERLLSPGLLSPLREALKAKRISTRVEAISLIAQINDPSSLGTLLEHLDDSSPTVCERVLSALVRREDERLDVELLKLAFGERWILRSSSYALLAVIDREDQGKRAILDERHARSLLIGLEARDPMVSGACAAALAGIGFRCAPSDSNTWLDAMVPTKLVAAVSGVDFHPDYASLQPRALRRLELISGEQIGANAEGWLDWWIGERSGFKALRALFPITPEEASHFVLRYRSPEGAFVLSGAEEVGSQGADERVVIGAVELEALVESLREWGLFSAELLPGVRGVRSSDEREFTLRLGSQSKTFVLGKGRQEPWFSSVEELFLSHRDRQRWQRFVPLPDEARGPWLAEVLWWESDQDELSRALRLKRHLVAHLQSVSPYERQSGFNELERVLAVDGAGMITDLDPILEFIMEEALYSERAERLVSLARGLIHGEGEAAEMARGRLLTVLLGHFEEAGAGSAAALLHDFSQGNLFSLGSDEDPFTRALIAGHFSGSKLPEEQALLLAFLEDEDSRVEAAAVASLGHVQLEGARTELLLRARISEGIVRQAALEACGRLGGEGVLEALIQGLAERDLNYQLSALRGLAHLADPDQISFFVSYLQLGEQSPHYRIAFDALKDFGPAAYPALLRIANLKRHKAHRACALLLARAGRGEVATALVAILEDGPDAEVAYELAVLTCFDLRSAEKPALEYGSWLTAGGHQDPWRWFQEAIARRELECPPRVNFEGEGTRAGALFLLDIVSRSDSILAERGRRELEALLGVEVLAEPARSEDRQLWLETLNEVIERVYPAAGGEE
jgi:HEAT repeat protein